MPGSNYDRDLTVKEGFVLSKFLVKWEMILVYILVALNLVLAIFRSDLYFTNGTVQSIINSGLDVSPMVLGMVFILLLGDIDVSVAAEMVLGGMVTGLSMDAGLPAPIAVILGILVCMVCGAFNGFCVAFLEMPAVITTISTSMLFRGIVEIVLGENSLKNFPKWYNAIGWKNMFGILPISMILFLIMGAIFIFVLHRTTFGRKVYIVGNNPTCATYSGISVKGVKMSVFILMGFMAGIGSIFFVGRMGGGLSSSMGTGYEMTAIACAVLGGVSTNGGKGKMYGPIIATFIMAFLTYTLGLLGIDPNTKKIFTGVILIVTILISTVNKQMIKNIKLKLFYHNNKNIEAINDRTNEAVKERKKEIKELKKSNDSDRDKKIAKLTEKIAAAQKECKEKSAAWWAEQQEDARKAKERFEK
ncbi:MAG: ABC transporter permease [Eubacteriales bacterium]|nr:ABC transporter permease [Eubacteriales bacterium]